MLLVPFTCWSRKETKPLEQDLIFFQIRYVEFQFKRGMGTCMESGVEDVWLGERVRCENVL